MSVRPCLFVVLAAGKGTRMKSSLPKVLHKIAGQSMLAHVLTTASRIEGGKIAVVVGPGMDAVGTEAVRVVPGARMFEQSAQLGTADAVLAAKPALDEQGADSQAGGDVVVLFADTPLVRGEVIERLRAALDSGANIAVLGFRPKDPTGYGRLLIDDRGGLTGIREEQDATDAERDIGLCNSGVMAFRVPRLSELLSRIGSANAKGEYYLTDAIEIARQQGLKATVVECDESDVLGVNTREQLAVAEGIWQARARSAFMRDGVTMVAPETVWLNFDTRIASDVSIEPNVIFAAGVTVEEGVQILGFCHIEGATIGKGARIGPFARFRPGARIGANVHIGNFVEVKNVTLGEGAKANHLSYLGDGSVGAGANIGAGTIFCNYDGYNKEKTEIGEGAFIGSNTSLVAPLKIGAGAYIGSGSVITKDVSPGALAIERSAQEERPGWAEKFRAVMSRRKAAQKR
ncbi:bifunctional UDP-N-acetylglucosamine diphosphorylase/glucosamine-1-phosphate N-acetyltransferase GlmU [Hyphomicrobium sp.]|uniref:bifunctional UDP-N-acetylglucosamine diphosphorylase/glucosamine-1-phosphate N-acetyltransferase GlmU n=1 Tax=Hyphomicrobium sp. TaxID=82 RepID=UPI001DB0F2AB|nr:bifunctional UDP-N-acetylglucosamine diphosphorylase/glucosamine-1-phosphate N-acetyltransferase GlmU [Hyphomicrobium sp.]MBY0560374.1 bifunctional UDP-N-acetylglucosamine diphosphorylase/glucosamine-1-phosphate N-acetyltransferase GlmU [Hyphomicrobium sp.]